MNNWNLTGKRALVTGSSKGIGFAAAREMGLLGAEVCLIARNEPGLQAAIDELEPLGIPAWGIPADVSHPRDQQRVLEQVLNRWDRLDILVNNTGMNIRKNYADYEESEYRRVFETNLFSAMAMTQLFFPLLKASGNASVVNVASVAGLVDVRSGAPYGMTKAGLIQMTRHLAVEWAPLGIRVNAVSPWYTRTPLAEPVLQQPDRLTLILNNTPIGRIAEAEEVAAAIAFLCMDKASYITGQNLVVDGGMIAQGM